MRGIAKDSRFRSPANRRNGGSKILMLGGLAVGLFVSFLIVFFVSYSGTEGNHKVVSSGKLKGSTSTLEGVKFEKIPNEEEHLPPPKSLAIPETVGSNDETAMLSGIEEIRAIKKSGRVIEKDSEAQTKIPKVQELIRTYVTGKYGPGPHMIEMDITLPNYLTAPKGGQKATLLIEMAPIEYLPYTVYFFLENIVNGFKKGNFHRNAGHVLQAMLSRKEGLKHTNFAWQEYSPKFAHKKYTMGFAGRPSGSSAIYVSTLDNSFNHGPGSQGSKTEADVCWGKLADQASIDVVEVMKEQKGGSKGSGFINDNSHFIAIDDIRLVSSTKV